MSKVSSLGHVGLFVQDMETMLDFYTRILGLTVTDGERGRGVFLSAHPDTEHHELLLSLNPERRTNPQQLSFKIDSLDELREMYQALRDYGIETFRTVNHGVAIGCYFRDPENNNVEVYWSTGMDYPQPHAAPIDLELSTKELMGIVENMAPKEGSGPRFYGRDAGKRLLN